MSKSSMKFGATLLLGRAGTGKSSLAATYARDYQETAWYSIDSADADWNDFFRYFMASFHEPLLMKNSNSGGGEGPSMSTTGIAYSVEGFFARLSVIDSGEPRLIVLDNIHNVFDSEWFTSFFQSLIYSLLPNMHLVINSRCRPPTPLWRLRSKQRLGVIDEDLLSFNEFETREFFRKLDLSPEVADHAYSKSFGRISSIKELAGSHST